MIERTVKDYDNHYRADQADLTLYKIINTTQVVPSEKYQLVSPRSVTDFTAFRTYHSSCAPCHYGVESDSRYVLKQTFNSYDQYGNLLQSTDANGFSTTTKWGYNYSRPIATFINANDNQTFFEDFGSGDLAGWTTLDQGSTGNTLWSNENGMLKLVHNSPFNSYEFDRISYDHPTEISGSTVLEFDLRIADSNSWDLIIGMGGDQWNGQEWSGTEMAVWSAINNESWYYATSSWYAIKTGFVVGKMYHFKVIVNATNGTVDYYVDGQRLIQNAPVRQTTSGIKKVVFGRYGYSTVASTWYIDNVRLYPVSSTVVSTSYDPSTLLQSQTQDENGNVKSFSYDPFGRLTKEFARIGDKTRLISEHRYQYSRTVGDVYSTSRPNSIATVNYESTDGFSDFSTSAGWGWSSTGVTFDMSVSGEKVVRMGWGNTWSSIWKPAGSGHCLARVDFYPDNSTSGTPHVLAFDDGSWRFCVQYYPSSNVFHIQEARNGWTTVNDIPLTNLSAPRNQWYTVEIEKTEGGDMYAYVYPKGAGRIYASGYMHYTTGFPANWNANVQSWSSGDYFYLANHYIGLPSYRETFLDGLGRDIQDQQQLKARNIVSSATTYDELGRVQKLYKPYDLDFGTTLRHQYDPSFSTNSSSYYPNDGGYTYFEKNYFADGLGRPRKEGNPGASFAIGANPEHVITQEYWSNGSADVSNYSANTLRKNRQLDENGNVVDTYMDMFGNKIATTVDPGSGELNLQTRFEYSLLGNITKSTPPKGGAYSSTYDYNTLSQLTQKTSPDGGATQFVYDNNGNLRFVKDANHTGGNNSVYLQLALGFPENSTNAFTLEKPGIVSLTVNPADLYDEDEFGTIQIVANGVVVCSISSDSWNSGNTSIYLPKGNYTLISTTNGGQWGYGYFDFIAACDLGCDFIYKKYDAFDRLVEEGEYVAQASENSFTQAKANDPAFPGGSKIVSKKFFYDVPSGDPLAVGQRNLEGRLSYTEAYRLGDLAVRTFYSYDERALPEWLLHYGLGWYSKKLTYTYDLLGNEIKKGYTDYDWRSGSFYTSYRYDQIGRLQTVATSPNADMSGSTQEASYDFYAAGNPKRLQLATAQGVDYRYNERNWLKSINHQNLNPAQDPGGDGLNGIPVDKFAMVLGHNDITNIGSAASAPAQWNGNISWTMYNISGVNFGPTSLVGYAYTYDRADRLTNGDFWNYTNENGWTSTPAYDENYTYDGNGNFIDLNRYNSAGVLTNQHYNYHSNPNNNQLASISGSSYSYDANGNVSADSYGGIAFVIYDIDNHPVSIYKTSGERQVYSYDINGNRVRKLVEGGSDTYYFNNARGKTEVVDLVPYGYNITYNIWGTDLIGQVRITSGLANRYYYLKDHLGSIRVTVNSSGTVVGYDDYYPFGKIMDGGRSYVSSADFRFRFTGKERDIAETGYDYFGARYYDARIGRWMSADQLAEKYPQWSPFVYAMNDPIKFVDPDGKRVIYTDKTLQKLFSEISSRSAEFRLIVSLYEQKDATGKDIGPDLIIGSGKLGTESVDKRGNLREKLGETETGISNHKLVWSRVTVDVAKSRRLKVDLKQIAAHEMGHAYEAAYDTERYESLTDQEEDIDYDDRQSEKDAEGRREIIMDQYHESKKKRGGNR